MASPAATTRAAAIRGQALVVLVLALLAGWPGSAAAQLEGMRISELGSGDRLKSDGQRKMVRDLARRHLGAQLETGDPANLRTLQRLLDAAFVKPDQTFEMQAMGVVLGDVLAVQRDLDWVAVDDDYGHSRALRFRETEHLFFPVTMISKRVRLGDRVDVRALYDQVVANVEKLKKRTY